MKRVKDCGIQTQDFLIDLRGFCQDEESENDVSEEEEEGSKKSFKFDGGGDVDYGVFGGDSDEEGDDDDDDDDDGDDDDGDDDDGKDSDDEDDEERNGDDDSGKGSSSQKILRQDLKSEVTKGLAIKQQLAEWDSLFECRIQIQKILSKINQFPQPDTW